MRIIMVAGKGGVGKTSVASATGLLASRFGYRTIIMSLDAAHSLADVFDLDRRLMDKNRGLPIKVEDNLWIQELDVQEELQKNWGEVHRYFSALLNTTGFDEVLAEELAILPGMEEVSSLLHINRYFKQKRFDAIILDCAPTGESIRFISIPTALEWYIKKIFNMERRIARLVRPVARRITDVPLPEDRYFANLEELFNRLEGVDRILTDPSITTVRLVTNPEKIVLKETQRAFMYFSLYKTTIDLVVVNRVMPSFVKDGYFEDWRAIQREYIERAQAYFSPIPIHFISLFRSEVLGKERLAMLARELYGNNDPLKVFCQERPFEFRKEDGRFRIRIRMPFVTKDDVQVHKIGSELVVRVGAVKKVIMLPRTVAHDDMAKATLKEGYLEVTLRGEEND